MYFLLQTLWSKPVVIYINADFTFSIETLGSVNVDRQILYESKLDFSEEKIVGVESLQRRSR